MKRVIYRIFKTKIVFVELSGGLGNQIFLLEAAKFLASLDNRVILLNDFHIDRKHSQGRSTVKDFVLPYNVKFISLSRYISILLVHTKKYLKRFNKINQKQLLTLTENESNSGKDAIMQIIDNKRPKVIWLTDFWQNFSYWCNDLKYDLINKSTRYEQLTSQMAKTDPIIVHYRLGRINNDWEHSWGALSPKYIDEALKHSEHVSNRANLRVWIFSNDLEHARYLIENFRFKVNYNFEFIDDTGMSPAEVMKLFSECKFFICSNSTFGLAAARIGGVPNVFVPSELSYRGAIEMAFPNDWTKIESTWL